MSPGQCRSRRFKSRLGLLRQCRSGSTRYVRRRLCRARADADRSTARARSMSCTTTTSFRSASSPSCVSSGSRRASPSHSPPQAASGDLPHMLFYGPSGAGKKTRISATLRAIFGPGAEKAQPFSTLLRPQLTPVQLKIDQRVFVTPSRRKLDVNVVQSNFHIELTPRYVRRVPRRTCAKR